MARRGAVMLPPLPATRPGAGVGGLAGRLVGGVVAGAVTWLAVVWCSTHSWWLLPVKYTPLDALGLAGLAVGLCLFGASTRGLVKASALALLMALVPYADAGLGAKVTNAYTSTRAAVGGAPTCKAGSTPRVDGACVPTRKARTR